MHQSVQLVVFPLLLAIVASLPTNNGDYFSNPYLNLFHIEKIGGNLRYTFGKRASNDRLVSHNTENANWASPQNVTLILQYPGKEYGATVTFVEIVVNQSSNIGAARVIAGGIGKRFIACIVEGNRTYWFNYSANIYGI